MCLRQTLGESCREFLCKQRSERRDLVLKNGFCLFPATGLGRLVRTKSNIKQDVEWIV